ncbi:hypothetical protein BLOT_011279 [Blomia tropicalis]|nr:hypothetical protein BLOT_011279 [Blomia tropicalis]
MGVGVIFLFTCLFGGLGFGVPAFLPETNANKDIIKLMVTMNIPRFVTTLRSNQCYVQLANAMQSYGNDHKNIEY